MKKIMLLVLSLTFISTVLFGCQSNESNTINTGENKPEEQSEVDIAKLKIDGEIQKVSISKKKGNSEIVIEDSGSIETLKTIISSDIKVNGIANMTNPEYYMDVTYENGSIQNFHLWIGEKGKTSTLMNTNDTHTIYTVSEEMTDKLIELIE